MALLGVLKAGGAYVPLDTGYPAERLLTWWRMPACGAADAGRAAQAVPVPEQRAGGVPRRRLAADRGRGARAGSGVTLENLAYVIYTSGSTGRPKGVAMDHAGWAIT